MFNRKIIQQLNNWRKKSIRKPLIIRGARQVGKTSAILMFAKKHFLQLVHINLEKSEHAQYFKNEISLTEFEKIINTIFSQKLIPGKTLLFIDEIQNSPALIKLLRFFYEDRPKLHVIAAGSLLQVKIEKQGFSLPVGRVEYGYMHPLDFFEYLEAKKELELLTFLKNIAFRKPIPQAIHERALNLFYEYVMLGGMPEIIKISLEKGSINEIKGIYSSLFTSYLEDVYKYSSQANVKYIAYVLEQAPLFAGTAISYEKFGQGNFRSREMNKAFELLEKVMLLYQVQATKSTNIPIITQRKRPKKLLFLDVGLVNYKMNILEDFLHLKDLNEFYRGRIAEQIVGQNIIAQYANSPHHLFYWAQDKSKGQAEVDFCFNQGSKICAIEVKSGKSNRLRSLYQFAQTVKNHKLIRIHSENLKKEQIKIANKKFDLLSMPFYLTPRIFETLQ